MKMINELNVNQKVGIVFIRLYNDNPINEEIIRMTINSCNNVYAIYVYDCTDSIDNNIHDLIK